MAQDKGEDEGEEIKMESGEGVEGQPGSVWARQQEEEEAEGAEEEASEDGGSAQTSSDVELELCGDGVEEDAGGGVEVDGLYDGLDGAHEPPPSELAGAGWGPPHAPGHAAQPQAAGAKFAQQARWPGSRVGDGVGLGAEGQPHVTGSVALGRWWGPRALS